MILKKSILTAQTQRAQRKAKEIFFEVIIQAQVEIKKGDR